MNKKYRIGVDLGGTNLKIALVDRKGEIIYSNSVPTNAEMGYEYTINNIKEAIKNCLKETNTSIDVVEGIGIGCPGQVNSETGLIKILPNIPGWVNVQLGDILNKEFNLPVKVDNDVRCATLGEYNFGAGKDCKNIICITVGTGVGSGIVLNGQLIRGAGMSAGELGHMTLIDNGGPICGCGNTGCLEALASGPSIVKMANDYIMGGKSAKFRELAAGSAITPYIVYEAAKQGDQVAQRFFKITGYWLGVALANAVNLINPEKIIIGGGVAKAGDLLFDPVRQTIKEKALPVASEIVKVVPAELGESAGVVGASLLLTS